MQRRTLPITKDLTLPITEDLALPIDEWPLSRERGLGLRWRKGIIQEKWIIGHGS